MSLFGGLFRKARPAAVEQAKLPTPPTTIDRVDVQRGIDLSANADILAGWRFCATMQVRTPARVLSRHGELHADLSSPPPVIATEMWEGIWLPETKTFAELGFGMAEPQFSMASDVGPIPSDGGDYLPFLLAVREAAERDGSPEARRAAVERVLDRPASERFVASLGREAVLARLFPPFLTTIPRLSGLVAAAIEAKGWTTPQQISALSDGELRSITGVGPKVVAALREAAGAARLPGSHYVDMVLR